MRSFPDLLRQYFISLKNSVLKKNPVVWIFLLLGLIILTNEIHFYYPDEFENILGGHFIIIGKLPYVNFFSHHNPGAFFLSAIINIFSGVSFVHFRILLGVIFLTSYIFFYNFIRKRFGAWETKLVLCFYVFITFGATYFWGHMLLADSLSAYLITPAYIICMLLAIKKESLLKNDLWLISILAFLTIFTTFTQLFSSLIIYLFLFLLNIQSRKVSWKNFFIIVFLPFLLFFLYLVVSRSLLEYYRQAINFNTAYYVSLPDNTSLKNPLRVAIVFSVKFFENFKTALLMVKDLSFGSPFIHTLALSNATLIIYFAIKRQFSLLAILWFFLTFINARGNPYATTETDYQTIVYHFVSIFNGLLAVSLLWKEIKSLGAAESYKKLLLNTLILLLALYQISLLVFFFSSWLDKSYKKYMGTQALIYDRPTIAMVLNSFITQSEYYYIVPFDFENQLYMKSKLASKYMIILPAMDRIPRMQEEILSDLKKNRPKIIVFNTELSIYQAYPGKFFNGYLNQEYITLEGMGVPCNGYKSKQKWYGDYDFERHFYFDKNQKDQLWNLLLEKDLIYPISQAEVNQIPRCVELKQNQQKQMESTPSGNVKTQEEKPYII